MTVHVLDERRQPVGAGEIGELWVGGIGVGRGYLHAAAQTADAFVTPDPFDGRPGTRLYRTGDRGRRRDGRRVRVARAPRRAGEDPRDARRDGRDRGPPERASERAWGRGRGPPERGADAVDRSRRRRSARPGARRDPPSPPGRASSRGHGPVVVRRSWMRFRARRTARSIVARWRRRPPRRSQRPRSTPTDERPRRRRNGCSRPSGARSSASR